jgi:hypothetical protein
VQPLMYHPGHREDNLRALLADLPNRTEVGR